ncbi:GGDEF domain-containing protein [Oceanicoccus sp. KOV_DT_Chl]|uniref:GGDEF domain-containing protein n=1 Tax=Oceanicoccus sp. KOV_DT_Chl TaxID=1904639 RepID=UPI000C7DFE68|nr:GGDEF domain-containing protein [Oceanicoccus sp. KOV_DT_Chl]
MLLKPLSRLIYPLLLLLVAVYLLGQTQQVDRNYLKLLEALPYLLFSLVLGLAHFFNRSRSFSAALLMALGYWLIQSQLQTTLEDNSPFYIYTAVSLLLPLGLIMLMLLPEKGLWNQYSSLVLAVPLILLALAYAGQNALDDNQWQTLNMLFALRPWPNYILSVYVSLWFLVSLLLGLSLLAQRDSEAEATLSGCILFSFVTLAFFDQQLISTIMFSAAGLALLIGLLRSSFEMAYRDDLTGLLGRRALNEKLRGLGRQYVIAMMDVDHFKKFNDTHGHDVGDDVLKIVANHIAAVTGGGIPYRYGGEEFCIIFPGKKIKPCIPHLEAVREAIADYDIALRDKPNRPAASKEGAAKRSRKTKPKTVAVTISIGVAEKTEQLSAAEEVLKAADKSLYQAKQDGRNCLAH